MSIQTSTDYGVDNRYRGMEKATDNTRGKEFLGKYIKKAPGTITQDQKEDGRIIMSAPGWEAGYVYRNAFGSPRSPAQRRISKLNQ